MLLIIRLYFLLKISLYLPPSRSDSLLKAFFSVFNFSLHKIKTRQRSRGRRGGRVPARGRDRLSEKTPDPVPDVLTADYQAEGQAYHAGH